ncbi:DNA recombination protein RmuC [Rhizobium albus]|nr:DNA recombination protein RmuC [Rhizobium albus]
MVDLSLLAQPLFTLGDAAVSFGMAGATLLVVLAILWMWRSAVRRAERAELVQAAEESEQRLAEILKAQSEMQGRMATMAELFGARQAELNQSIQQRLDGMTQRLGTTLTEQTRSTHENLTKLQERLAVIDTAQNNIQSLAKDVVGLQAILSNKQTRGAFGQSRMETIIADALPMGSYTFQATLSNNQRPDCLIHMPNGQPSLAIDAKFPLEAWHAIRAAENAEAAKPAAQQFRRDMDVHIRAISEKYLIKGETQDTAFLFVPSESIFAEIHENFEEIVQRAHRARVVIVSPSLLMLSIQVVQAILRDQRMREQAHLIQGEVAKLMMDLTRLDQRVRNLQTHFGQTQKDIDQIVTSTDKLAKRGARIEALELEAPGADTAQPAAEPTQAVESRTGSLRLRVVEED